MLRGVCLLLVLGLAACGGQSPTYHASGNPALLSEWGMMQSNGRSLDLADRVLAYDLNTPLFTDYAHKQRTIWMPEGVSAEYREGDVLDFPVGTVITKTFYYPLNEDGERLELTSEQAVGWREDGLDLANIRLMETRILVRREAGWTALPYVWNDEQTDAVLARAGHVARVEAVTADGADSDFAYVVPNANQCAGCHAVNNTTRAIQPIGPAPRHLNRDYSYEGEARNQIAQLELAGYLSSAPDVSDIHAAVDYLDISADLDRRARDYLDINCAHCHNPVGPADTSGLHLNSDAPADVNLGLCKLPIAAGGGTGNRLYSITPGHPDDSILLYRMEITDPGSMMPELGRSLVHAEGVELIREWIETLPETCT